MYRIAGMVLFACAAAFAQTEKGPAALDKKLIEYGWDVPTPDFIRTHAAEMQKRPFDGLIFRLRAGSNVLDPKPMDEAALKQDCDDLANIAWGSFTDNFVTMLAASDQDWFDDAQWAIIEKNVALAGHAGRAGKCIGVCFDPEPYGTNPWDYKIAKRKDTVPFAAYEAQARKRGAQVIKAVEREMPGPVVLGFYQLALFASMCVNKPDAAERAKFLAAHDYALYPAFFNGMLEASSPGTRFVDGNENAYYYKEAAQYFDAYHRMKQRALYLVDPALHTKYRAQVEAGQALYVDQYFGLREPKESAPGYFLTPEERPIWFAHNVYWSLFTSDHYVWCYSERMNWWTNKDVPPGAEEAIRRARESLAAGRTIADDPAPLMKHIAEREHAEKQKEKEKK